MLTDRKQGALLPIVISMAIFAAVFIWSYSSQDARERLAKPSAAITAFGSAVLLINLVYLIWIGSRRRAMWFFVPFLLSVMALYAQLR